MIKMNDKRELGKSVLAAQDDVDDDIYRSDVLSKTINKILCWHIIIYKK